MTLFLKSTTPDPLENTVITGENKFQCAIKRKNHKNNDANTNENNTRAIKTNEIYVEKL